jgi:hypothetical protein
MGNTFISSPDEA